MNYKYLLIVYTLYTTHSVASSLTHESPSIEILHTQIIFHKVLSSNYFRYSYELKKVLRPTS